MGSIGTSAVLFSLVAMQSVFAPHVIASNFYSVARPEPGVSWEASFQPADEALAEDIASVTKVIGWTARQAESYPQEQAAIETIALRVAEMGPTIFVGSAYIDNALPVYVPTV